MIMILQTMFTGYNPETLAHYIKKILVVLMAFMAPLATWIYLIEFFVFAEYVSQRMIKNSSRPQKRFSWFLVKAALFVIALSEARGLESAIFPNVPIAQYVAAGILIYQFQLTLKNISEYTGVNVWDGITEELHRLLTEMIKSKKQ